MRSNTSQLQLQLDRAQHEAVHSRVYDVETHLGTQNSRHISLLSDIERLGRIVDTNSLTKSRLDVSLDGIASVGETGQGLMASLTVAMGQQVDPSVTAKAGVSAMDTMSSILNTTLNGQHIFGGVNGGQQVINDFETGGGKAALEAAFTTHFGFPKTDPAAAALSGSDMRNFLDTVVEPMFSGADWTTYFSNATDEVVTARIGFNQTVDGTASANEQGFRDVFFVAATMATFFEGSVSGNARAAAAERGLEVVNRGVGELSSLQGRVGYVTNIVNEATDRLTRQIDSLTLASDDMVSVDPYEAASRVNELLTQIETSYTLTGRMQQLNLLRYL